MEGSNGKPFGELAQEGLRNKVAADARRENEFVTGYMALMKCSEPAARAVFMYSDLPPKQNAPQSQAPASSPAASNEQR